MFRRDAETLEVVVMWSRGGASGWEHVFRATDSAAWVCRRLATEFAKLRSALNRVGPHRHASDARVARYARALAVS